MALFSNFKKKMKDEGNSSSFSTPKAQPKIHTGRDSVRQSSAPKTMTRPSSAMIRKSPERVQDTLSNWMKPISYTGQSKRYNYSSTPQNQWTSVQQAAYARTTGNQVLGQKLSQDIATPGSQFYNPYRGGRTTLTQGDLDILKAAGAYNDGDVLDQKWYDDHAYLAEYLRQSDTYGAQKYTKKSNALERAAYVWNRVGMNQKENDDVDTQWSDFRADFQNYYSDYQLVNGRAPTLEECMEAVNVGNPKFNKLASLDQSFGQEHTVQILPRGTYYCADVIPGLYYALQNGGDISEDRDYFEDAVQYAMSPVATAQSTRKFEWSGSDLSQINAEERDKQLNLLNSQGKREEYVAFQKAWWDAQPHEPGVDRATGVLDSAFGFYHDDKWFNAVNEAIGDEYARRLDYEGKMTKPGKNASYMDNACWELYQANQHREYTDSVQNAWNDAIYTIQEFADANLGDYGPDEYEAFKRDVTDYLNLGESELKSYFKTPKDTCRPLVASQENLDAIISRAFKGQSVRSNIDYSTLTDELSEISVGKDKPASKPPFFDQQQQQLAEQRVTERDQAEEAVANSVLELSNSGIPTTSNALPLFPNAGFDSDEIRAKLRKLWGGFKKADYTEKLGEDYTPDDAAAADPVMAQLLPGEEAEILTARDMLEFSDAASFNRIVDAPLSLFDGILKNALPGLQELGQVIMDAYDSYSFQTAQDMANMPFDALTYKTVYEDRIGAGADPYGAARIACFAATKHESISQHIAMAYDGDDMLRKASEAVVSDILHEPGARDTLEVLSAINDDVTAYQESANPFDDKGPNVDLIAFNTAVTLGASESADAGYKAQTSQVLNSYFEGEITEEDIVEGTKLHSRLIGAEAAASATDDAWAQAVAIHDAETGATPEEVESFEEPTQEAGEVTDDDWTKAVELYDQQRGATSQEVKSFLPELPKTDNIERIVAGLTPESAQTFNEQHPVRHFTPEDKVRLSDEAHHFLDAPYIDPDAELSDDLKTYIHYDQIRAMAEQNRTNLDDALTNALFDAAYPDQAYGTRDIFDGRTDVSASIAKFAGNKSDERRAELAANSGRNAFQTFVEGDMTGIALPIASAFFYEQTDLNRLDAMFKNNGRYFSRRELDDIAFAFQNGDISIDEARQIIDERKQAVPRESANYLVNYNLTQKMNDDFDAGIARFREAAAAGPADILKLRDSFKNGENIEQYMADNPEFAASIDYATLRDAVIDPITQEVNQEELNRLVGERIDADIQKNNVFYWDDAQVDAVETLVDLVKNMEQDGIWVATMDNETIKSMTGGKLDLDAAGFQDQRAIDLLNAVNPNWLAPYTSNPGDPNVLKVLYDGILQGSVYALPATVAHFAGIMGAALDPNYKASDFSIARQFDEYETQNREHQNEALTGGQKFVQTGVAEVTRNLVNSLLGSQIGEAVSSALQQAMSGGNALLWDAISNMSGVGAAIDLSARLGSHSMLAFSAFSNDTYNNLKQGDPMLKAIIKGTLGAGIEIVTEDMPLEKMFYGFNMNGLNLAQHADNAIGSMSFGLMSFASREIKNICTEISEEEVGAVMNRLVDFGDYAIGGAEPSEAWSKAMEGLAPEMVETAKATAFTTAIFGAIDLGGLTSDLIRNSYENNIPFTKSMLLFAMQTDLAANLDESEQRPVNFEEAFETIDNAKAQHDTEVNEKNDFSPETDVPQFGEAPVSAEQSLVDASRAAITDNTEENQAKVKEAADEYLQELRSNPVSVPAPEQAQSTEEEQDASEGPSTASESVEQVQAEIQAAAPGTQQVQRYLANSQTAMDKVVVNKHAELEAQKAVNEDPGLKTQQKTIETQEAEIQREEEEADAIQQNVQTMNGQLRQAFAAAVSEGIDPTIPSPTVDNARMALTQSIDAANGDLADLQKKIKADRAKLDLSRQAYEDAVQTIRDETAESARKDASKALEEMRAEKAESDKEDEKDVLADKWRKSGFDVHSQFTQAQLDNAVNTDSYVTPRGEDDWRNNPEHDRNWERYSSEARLAEDTEALAKQKEIESGFKDSLARERAEEQRPVPYQVWKKVTDAMKAKYGAVDYTQVSRNAEPLGSESRYNPRSSIMSSDTQVAQNIAKALDSIAGKIGGNVQFKLFGENSRFIVFQRDNTEGIQNAEKYSVLTKRGGLKRFEEQIQEQERYVTRYTDILGKAQEALLQLKDKLETARNDGLSTDEDKKMSSELIKLNKQVRNAQIDLDNAQSKLSTIRQRYQSAQSFVSNYNGAKTLDRFYIIDKDAYGSETGEIDLLTDVMKRFQDAVKGISDEGLTTLIREEAMKLYSGPEGARGPVETFTDRELDLKNGDEKAVILFDHMLENARQEALQGRLRGAFRSVGSEREVHDLLDQIPDEHGNTMANTTTYTISRTAAQYLDENERKALGFTETDNQYSERIRAAIDRYGRAEHLTPEQKTQLETAYLTDTIRDDKGKPHYRAAGDDGHSLFIAEDRRNDSDSNRILRDDMGNYDMQNVYKALKQKLDFIGDIINGKYPTWKVDTKRDYIQVKYLDDAGQMHIRLVGETYQDTDGQTKYWLPSFNWLMTNALDMTCNFSTMLSKGQGPKTAVWFKLRPNTQVQEQKGVDYARVQEDLAYRRTQHELETELQSIVDFCKKWVHNDKDRAKAQNLYAHAMFNLMKNQYRTALDKASKATLDTVLFYADKVDTFRQKMNHYAEIIQRMGENNARQDDKHLSIEEWLPAAKQRYSDIEAPKPEYKPNNPTRTYKQLLDDARERMKTLQYDPVYSDESFGEDSIFRAEREVLARLIPYYEHMVDAMGKVAPDTEQSAAPMHSENELAEIKGRFVDMDAYKADKIDPQDYMGDIALLNQAAKSGEDVDAERSAVLSAYHEAKMQSMTDTEKILYLGQLAEKAKADPNSPIIDPNADYESQADQIYAAKQQHNKQKNARRLKDITRKAGSYQSMKYAQKAMDDLADFEKMGMNVGTAKEALQKNIDFLNGESEQSTAQEPEMEAQPESEPIDINLTLFSNDPTDMDETAGEILDRMTDSMPQLATGFEDVVDAVRAGNEEYRFAEDYEDLRNKIADANAKLKSQTEDIDAMVPKIQELESERDAIDAQLKAMKPNYSTILTDDQQQAYDALQAQRGALVRKINDKKMDKSQTVFERDELKAKRDLMAHSMSASAAAQKILTDAVAFTPGQMVNYGKSYQSKRVDFKSMASKLMIGLKKNNIYGKLTTFTAKQISDALNRENVINEADLAYNKSVATSVNAGLKEQKKIIILLDLGKAYLNLLQNQMDIVDYKQKRAAAFDQIVALTRRTGYTDEENSRHVRAFKEAQRQIDEWEAKLKSDIEDVGVDYNDAYYTLAYQRDILQGNLERAESIVKNFFDVSADGFLSALDNSKGGHKPVQLIQLAVGLIENGNNAKKNKTFHPVSLTFDTFPRVVDQFLGETAGVFNSMYVEPVMRANGEIGRRMDKLKTELKQYHLKTKAEREALGHILDQGMNETEIRHNYPEWADDLIKAKQFHQDMYEWFNTMTNVTYARNGLDPVPPLTNYFPHIHQAKNMFYKMLGIDDMQDVLPVGALGRTENTDPSKSFNARELHRHNETMDDMIWDAESVLLRYAEQSMTNIYQTDNIIALNDLLDALGAKESFDKDDNLGALDFTAEGKRNLNNMGTFVNAIRVFRNMLAGKKVGFMDRAMETTLDRKAFNALNSLTRMNGLAKVGGNMRPVFLNFIPVSVAASMNPAGFVKACAEQIASDVNQMIGNGSDGILERSNFYASRIMNDRMPKTTFDKMTGVLYVPMQFTDRLSTALVYRTLFNMNLKKTGGNLGQAIQLSDDMALRIMADKSRGMKGKAYASATGNLIFQFTQEAVNNISFLMNDLPHYMGTDKNIAAGVIKVLAALLAQAGSGYWLNKLVGKGAAIDPIGSTMDAINGAEEGDNWMNISGDALSSMADAINPVSSLSDGKLTDIPAIKSILDVLSPIKTGMEELPKIQNGDFSWDWTGDLAEALFGWVPGSAQMKRVYDTYNATKTGATFSKTSGNFKYAFDANPWNIFQSAMFGPNATADARDYINSGYRTQNQSSTERIKELHDLGFSWADAARSVTNSKKSNSLESEIKAGQKRGADTAAKEDEARQLREQTSVPSDISSALSEDDMKRPEIAKAIRIWQQTGLDVYPKDINWSENTYEGDTQKGYERKGRFVSVSEEEQAQLQADYKRLVYQALRRYKEESGDPQALYDEISKIPKTLKDKHYGGGK